MTAWRVKKAKRFSGIRPKAIKRGLFFALGILFVMLFLLRNVELAKAAVLMGLRRAGLGVFPAVFPFVVLADLLVSSGGLPRGMSAWLSPLLRLPPAACAAVLLGWIAGFPVGAVYAAREAERGNLTPEEGGRAVAAASVPSPAFLIGVVGSGLLQSATAGAVLWLFCIFSAMIVCMIFGMRWKKRALSTEKSTPSAPEPFYGSLTRAIRNAAGVSINLCAFIAFFSVLIAAVQAIFTRFGIPAAVGSSVAALLELSSGVFSASAVPALLTFPFRAAACGWAGFSVHFQIFSVCESMRLQFGKYLLAKLAQATLCFAFAGIWQLLR